MDLNLTGRSYGAPQFAKQKNYEQFTSTRQKNSQNNLIKQKI